jgi:hypothetical protein
MMAKPSPTPTPTLARPNWPEGKQTTATRAAIVLSMLPTPASTHQPKDPISDSQQERHPQQCQNNQKPPYGSNTTEQAGRVDSGHRAVPEPCCSDDSINPNRATMTKGTGGHDGEGMGVRTTGPTKHISRAVGQDLAAITSTPCSTGSGGQRLHHRAQAPSHHTAGAAAAGARTSTFHRRLDEPTPTGVPAWGREGDRRQNHRPGFAWRHPPVAAAGGREEVCRQACGGRGTPRSPSGE